MSITEKKSSSQSELEIFNEVEKILAGAASQGIRPGLERISRLMALLGNPQDSWPTIHVVGTNGKGSTCAFLASAFRAAGYHVALYTSPHLESPAERLLINGEPLSGARWLEAVRHVTGILNQDPGLVKDPPSYFELVTAAAFLLAAQEKVDIGIIEAGLGGRLDATNLLGQVACSVVASISMDHTEFLGDTLEKIAGEKFAVVRKDRPACFVGRDASVIEQFKKTCAAANAIAYVLPEVTRLENIHVSENGCDFDFKCPELEFALKNIHTSLIGQYQIENASLALLALSLVRKQFPNLFSNLTDTAILEGMAGARWPGRLEIFSREPLVILDGGHNYDGVKQLVTSVKALWPDKKIGLVYAAMRDKEYNSCLELLNLLSPSLCALYATEVPGMARCLPADEMCAAASRFQWRNTPSAYPSPIDAVKASIHDKNTNDLTLVCGSLYMLGWLRPKLNQVINHR